MIYRDTGYLGIDRVISGYFRCVGRYTDYWGSTPSMEDDMEEHLEIEMDFRGL